MDSLNHPKLSDGVVFLRPLNVVDAAAHLSGEDDEIAKWLSGGRSTIATVEAFIQDSANNWQKGGPRRAFGLFDCATNRLVGFIEANLAFLVDPGHVNISFGVFREWRRQGLALRAIRLIAEYLRTETDARRMVLRISPDNLASLKLAEKAGFTFCGLFEEAEGPLRRYIRDLRA